MDPITLAYYGLICGALGAAGPRLGGLALRFAIGVAVGLGAAAGLPHLHAAIGG